MINQHPYPEHTPSGRGGHRRPVPDDFRRAQYALAAAENHVNPDDPQIPRAHRPSPFAVTRARQILNQHPDLANEIREGRLSLAGAVNRITVKRRNAKNPGGGGS